MALGYHSSLSANCGLMGPNEEDKDVMWTFQELGPIIVQTKEPNGLHMLICVDKIGGKAATAFPSPFSLFVLARFERERDGEQAHKPNGSSKVYIQRLCGSKHHHRQGSSPNSLSITSAVHITHFYILFSPFSVLELPHLHSLAEFSIQGKF